MATQTNPPSSSPANGSPANSSTSSTSGGNAREKAPHGTSRQPRPGVPHAPEERQDQPAEETERHHEQRQQDRVPEPRQHDRPGRGDDPRIEEGLDQRFHANRVST